MLPTVLAITHTLTTYYIFSGLAVKGLIQTLLDIRSRMFGGAVGSFIQCTCSHALWLQNPCSFQIACASGTKMFADRVGSGHRPGPISDLDPIRDHSDL